LRYNSQLTAEEKAFFFSLIQDISLIHLLYKAHCSSMIIAVNPASLSDEILTLLVHDSLLLLEGLLYDLTSNLPAQTVIYFN
jgi:hypothetical protein